MQWRIIYRVVFCFSCLSIFKKGNGLQACIKISNTFFMLYLDIKNFIFMMDVLLLCCNYLGELYLGEKADLLFE